MAHYNADSILFAIMNITPGFDLFTTRDSSWEVQAYKLLSAE